MANVRIDVQGSSGRGFYAEIRRATGTARLIDDCGHVTDERHPTPDIANRCGENKARSLGHVVCE